VHFFGHLHSKLSATRRTRDLGHAAAQRMLADRAFTLADVQTILRHASATTPELATRAVPRFTPGPASRT
jgi:hypothetical protein